MKKIFLLLIIILSIPFLVSATNWNFNFSNWNTSSFKNMERMFEFTGNYADYIYRY